jgi:mannose 2-epimerase
VDAIWAERLERWLGEVQDHLRDELLPFWFTHGQDTKHGGFLTYLDKDGRPTGETDKTLVCQARCIFTYSEIERAGMGHGKALEIAQQGFEFLIDHFWDDDHGGWIWVTKQDGTPVDQSKLSFGQSFTMLALSEYAMASGDLRAQEWMARTYETFQTFAADNLNGGYYEFMERDWSKKASGAYGGDSKTFDVHMHLMEAFTNLYEATGAKIYYDKSREMVDLIFRRMIHSDLGTGYMQFAPDWEPRRAIIFRNVWGSDRDVDDPEGRPLNNTSFGHNVEFAWLLKHTIEILGLDMETYKPAIKLLTDHAVKNGIDWARGGVYCEGPMDGGPARETNKEFWQQSETMVGFLDAYLLFEDEQYLKAYENVHRFSMDIGINHDVGEWYPLFDENNTLLQDYMGHAWKINYHTVRSMLLCEKKLLKLTSPI